MTPRMTDERLKDVLNYISNRVLPRAPDHLRAEIVSVLALIDFDVRCEWSADTDRGFGTSCKTPVGYPFGEKLLLVATHCPFCGGRIVRKDAK